MVELKDLTLLDDKKNNARSLVMYLNRKRKKQIRVLGFRMEAEDIDIAVFCLN